MAINQRSDVVWTSYLACGKIEGFEDLDAEEIEAWAYLISTGDCWTLQGSYGRGAKQLLEAGYVSEKGVINWGFLE